MKKLLTIIIILTGLSSLQGVFAQVPALNVVFEKWQGSSEFLFMKHVPNLNILIAKDEKDKEWRYDKDKLITCWVNQEGTFKRLCFADDDRFTIGAAMYYRRGKSPLPTNDQLKYEYPTGTYTAEKYVEPGKPYGKFIIKCEGEYMTIQTGPSASFTNKDEYNKFNANNGHTWQVMRSSCAYRNTAGTGGTIQKIQGLWRMTPGVGLPPLVLKYVSNSTAGVEGPVAGAGGATGGALTTSSGSTIPVVDQLNPTTQRAQIHDFTISNDYMKVEELVVKKGADINVKDGAKGRSAVHYAALAQDDAGTEIIELLASTGQAELDMKDKEGKTPLDLALERGNFETAKILLKNNADASKANAGLDRVLRTKEEELLVLMLQHGADYNKAMESAIDMNDPKLINTVINNSKASANNTYFERAVSGRKHDAARELLFQGLDKDQALDYVIQKKDKQMVETVLGTGVSVTSANKALVFAVEQRDMALAQSCIMNYNAAPSAGMSKAVENNHLQMVEFLLQQGADPNAEMATASAQGKTPIVNAFLMQSGDPNLGVKPAAEAEQIATLQTLLDANGDANLAMPVAINKGHLAMVNMCISARVPADVYRKEYIITTCEKSNADILSALLMAGADPNPGMPISVGKKDARMVAELINGGADVNQPDYLITACKNQDGAVGKLLLDAGADPNPGMPVSVSLGDGPMVSRLLTAGADGTNPEYIATASGKGFEPIVASLLEAGSNPENGMMPSVQNNHAGITSRLISAGADGSKDIYMTTSVKHNNPQLTGALINAGGNPQIILDPSVDADSDKLVNLIHTKGVEITDIRHLVKCVQKNHVRTARVLVNAGASSKDYWDEGKGMSLLHIAIHEHLSPGMVDVLIKAGSDVDQVMPNGKQSPLHIAVIDAKQRSVDDAAAIVNSLIAAGANVNAINADGETVLKAAPSKKDITRPLKDAGAERKAKNVD